MEHLGWLKDLSPVVAFIAVMFLIVINFLKYGERLVNTFVAQMNETHKECADKLSQIREEECCRRDEEYRKREKENEKREEEMKHVIRDNTTALHELTDVVKELKFSKSTR